jgi:FdrA protein
MGPDCGTAIINGVGLGFANRVRRGPIGVVGASGTGLQQVTARIHQLGSGVTHALGTGGRDLSESVGAITMMQGLDLLTRDPNTEVIVLISKPPSPQVAQQLLERAKASGKPVVVDFIGYAPPRMRDGNLHYAPSLDGTAELAVSLANVVDDHPSYTENHHHPFAEGQKYLRGLFSGGTLAYEALLILQDTIPGIYSNVPLDKEYKLENALHSREHSIIDLGEDEFTVGRLHPMLDHTLRIQRLMQEANDPETAVILLDVVLGYGTHPDPAGELAPAIQKAAETASQAGRHLEVIAVVVGTDEDPQDMVGQIKALEAVGASVVTSNEDAALAAGSLIQSLNGDTAQRETQAQSGKEVSLNVIQSPLAAINVGLESFTESLQAQEAAVIHVNWRLPAGGNEKLMGILERMKSKG